MKICFLPLFVIIAIVFPLIVIYLYLNADSFTVDAASVNISAVVISLCGNGIVDPGEQCDGSDLNGQTCETLGYIGGVLSCSTYCAFVTSGCVPSGGAVRGRIDQPIQSTVIFEGKSSPQAKVIILKDSQVAAETIADSDANFQIILTGLSSGNYIFTAYSEDQEGLRTSLLVFPINVAFQATTKVSGIFIGPTIESDKEEVKSGENILVFGQSAPQANIRISIRSKDREFSANAVADNQGKYNYNFDTDSLELGQYQVTAMAFVGNVSSNSSRILDFIVGSETIFRKRLPKCPLTGDFDGDCRVNLVDFSILLYWIDRPNPSAKIDLNMDGKIDLVDFSIMAYYWTG